jgi:hypothetical protein
MLGFESAKTIVDGFLREGLPYLEEAAHICRFDP